MIAPAAVIPPHSLDAENAFPERKEDPHHSSWASSLETTAREHNKNTTADLSRCNGTSTIFGQHEVCPDRDDNVITRPFTTPSVRTSQSIHQHFVLYDLAHGAYDASLTHISDEVVLFWLPPSDSSQWTPSPFTVDLVNNTCAEQFMMVSKARLFGEHMALSAVLATDESLEQNHLGRHVRHFNHES